MTNNYSRRNFLKLSALSALTSFSNAQENMNYESKNYSYDVIIIGSGLAGIVASIVCAENNLSTLMIEKNESLGGNSIIGDLGMAVVNSSLQEQANIKDSVEIFVQDMNRYGKGLNDENHAYNIARNSSMALDFIMKRGAQFENKVRLEDSHSIARTVFPKGGAKEGLIDPLFKHLKTLKSFTLINNMEVNKIIKNSQNEVIGICSVSNNRTFEFRSKKGVIFASGGFAQDKNFRTIQNPLVKNIKSNTHINTNANSLKLLINTGAIPVQISLMRYAFPIDNNIIKFGCILDKSTGKRFTDESLERQELAQSILLKMKQNERNFSSIILYDSNGINSFSNNKLLKEYYKKKKINKFTSIESLASFHKINLKSLKKELQKYNKYVNSGFDEEYGKQISKLKIKKILIPPFYTMDIYPLLNYNQGGVLINTKAEVIDLLSNSPIKNLYAAGEVTGGIHGYNRIMSGSAPECLVYGILAAKSILKTN